MLHLADRTGDAQAYRMETKEIILQVLSRLIRHFPVKAVHSNRYAKTKKYFNQEGIYL